MLSRIGDTASCLLHVGAVSILAYREFYGTKSVTKATLLASSLIFLSVRSWDNYVLTRHAQQKSHNQRTSEASWVVSLARKLRKRRTKTSLIANLWKIIFTIGEKKCQKLYRRFLLFQVMPL